MADDMIDDRIQKKARPDPKRVRSRAKSLAHDQPDVEDPEAAAQGLLNDSESRTETDPAPRDLTEDRVERRTSEDATPPPEDGRTRAKPRSRKKR